VGVDLALLGDAVRRAEAREVRLHEVEHALAVGAQLGLALGG
jgi:hypothetical protein